MHHLFGLLFGTIVGVGWIAATGGWIAGAGPVGAIIAFAGGAIVMTLIGLCYAELMSTLPDASGAVGYAHRIFGDAAAFATGWLLILSYIATLSFFVVTLPWLVDAIFPAFTGPKLYSALGESVHAGPLALASSIALAIGYANHRGSAEAVGLQSLVVGIKICLMIVIVSAALINGLPRNLLPLFDAREHDTFGSAILAVMVTTPFWFAGFDVLPQTMRERQSGLDLSRLGWLVASTIAAAFVFYALIILAASMLLPRDQLLAARLPTFHAFQVGLGSPALATCVILLGIIGIVSAWNATVFACARIIQAMGHALLLPAWFGKIHPVHGTPSRAVWTVSFGGLVMGLGGSAAVKPAVEAASITLVASFCILCAGLIRLRLVRREPKPPYSAGPLAVPILALIASTGLLGLSILDLRQAATGVPLAWQVTMIWAFAGIIWWLTSARNRARIDSKVRARILAGIR